MKSQLPLFPDRSLQKHGVRLSCISLPNLITRVIFSKVWVNPKDRNVETCKRMIADWNEVRRNMKNVDIQFGYHNHNFEFASLDGIVPYYDLLMPEPGADLVTMEMDLSWASKARQDPVEIFNRYPGGFQLFHLKD